MIDVETEVAGWEVLATQTDPLLVGVRHHSPGLARVLPRLLNAARPDQIVLELPPEADDWLAWITHPDTVDPISLGVADQASSALADPGLLAFYPFAAFSPELVTLRWAASNGVPVICGDLAVAARHNGEPVDRMPETIDEIQDEDGAGFSGLFEQLGRLVGAENSHDVWDRLVEVRSVAADPEAVRRAALAAGWAIRKSDPTLDPVTAAREAAMRQAIRRAQGTAAARVVAVIGTYHAAALTAQTLAATTDSDPALLEQWRVPEPNTVRASLIVSTDAFLDPRSGYPAGIRDPAWQRAVLTAGDDRQAVADRVTALLTGIAAAIRAQGHSCGPGETAEAVRIAADLAALRGLPAPGRRELLEAMTSTFAHGEVLGRGRVVARAAEQILVGAQQGRLPRDVPRSGVAADFDAQVARLGLADRDSLTLEPLRNARDAEREVFLQRCQLAGIHFAHKRDTVGVGGAAAVQSVWELSLDARTEATLAGAGALGVSVAQCAAARLTAALRQVDPPSAAVIVDHLTRAADAGLVDAYRSWLDEAIDTLSTNGTLTELIDGQQVCQMVTSGLIAGASTDQFRPVWPATDDLGERCSTAAIRQVAGLAGSTNPDDAAALGRLGRGFGAGSLRLRHQLETLSHTGSALMQGASAAVLWDLDGETTGTRPDAPARWFPELLRAASHPEARRRLTDWVRGFLAAAPELLGSDQELTGALIEAIADLPDAQFVARLPALRAGFDPLTPVARERLLRRIGDQYAGTVTAVLDTSPEELARWAAADQAAQDRLRALGLLDVGFAPAARWRLILGRGRSELGPDSRRLARSLDQLYGTGAGEGSLADRARGGGQEAPIPGARVWVSELDELFGTSVREEVVAAGADQGMAWAVESLDADQARPSIDLLNTILSLRGALPEATLTRLRPLVRRIVDELARALANRLRPTLRGLGGHRRTLRNTKRLDPAATIRRNLVRAVRAADGEVQIVAAEPVFRQPVAKHAEWHVIVLVDVSGSMEPSTIFASLTAAILAGVPALSVTFLTFSTEVVDLTDHVDDPLALLMEIQVGGGTSIATGLRAARAAVRNPTRTLLVLISDFHEGASATAMLAETRTLAQAGVQMLGCAALDDTGVASYHVATAEQMVAAGMPVAAVTPDQLAAWVAEQINR